jgi:CitB family two-component system sensor histidine kinase MalK
MKLREDLHMLKKMRLRPLIILLVCLVVVLSLLITDVLISQHVTKTIKEDQEEKAKIIARIVAKDDIVRQGLIVDEKASDIQSYTADVLETADVLFIVVMDMDGIRKSHPNEENIGLPLKEGMKRQYLKEKRVHP